MRFSNKEAFLDITSVIRAVDLLTGAFPSESVRMAWMLDQVEFL